MLYELRQFLAHQRTSLLSSRSLLLAQLLDDMADFKGKKGKFTEIVRGQSQKLRSKFRKAITGDEKKRVRDHVQEQPDYVKLLDKIAFTLGLLNILACEYFLVKLPSYFWLWYSLVIPLLILTRISHFRSLGWQYFLLDFCYFVLFCVFINLYIFPDSQLFFKICFIYANGPLTWAIVVWRNSLVFHDYDKITSVYIHFLPCVLYYTVRWYGNDSVSLFQNDSMSLSAIGSCKAPGAVANSYEKLQISDFLLAAFGYLFWQLLYFAKTEILDRTKLDARPDLLTSLRWMSSDKKNFFAKFVLKICKKLGLLRADEHFDSYSTKTKIIFMAAQFFYSITTFLPTILLYNSQICHVAFLILIFCAAAFNGASFYIEVFSKVYQLKIEKLLEVKKQADAAAKVMYETVDLKIPGVGAVEDEFENSPATDAYSPVSDYDSSVFLSSRMYEDYDEVKEEDRDTLSDDDVIHDTTTSVKVIRVKKILDTNEAEKLSGECAPCVEISKDTYEKGKEIERNQKMLSEREAAATVLTDSKQTLDFSL